jgi:hypothetical protein
MVADIFTTMIAGSAPCEWWLGMSPSYLPSATQELKKSLSCCTSIAALLKSDHVRVGEPPSVAT